jgi:hypothetical protein
VSRISLGIRPRVSAAVTLVLICTGCSAGGIAPPPRAAPQTASHAGRHPYGLGPIVHPKISGSIVGFDIDQNGDDGVLANCCGRTLQVSLETFDQTTGAITRVVKKGGAGNTGYQVFGILGDDVGFIGHSGYELMDPVAGEKLTGKWTPPASFAVYQVAENQSTPEQALLGYSPSDVTSVVAADVVHNTATVIPLDQDLFSLGANPVIAQDAATHQAVIAAQNGSRYTIAVIGIIDLRSGKTTTFQGVGYGQVDGIGVDSKTDTACTTTGTDAGVEFYDLKKHTGFEVQLPNAGSAPEIHSGAGVAVDSIHGLCLVAQPVSGQGTQASAIWVLDEKGDFLEEIQGFNFWFDVGPAINPKKRIGYVASPRPAYETLTGFSY